MIELKVAEYSSRIEELNTAKRPVAALAPSTRNEDSINFEVVIQIDKVNVFLLHQKQQRQLVNNGDYPVRILSGQQSGTNGLAEKITFLQLTDSIFFPLNQSIPCLRISPGHYVLPKEDSSFYGLRFPASVLLFLLVFQFFAGLSCCAPCRNTPPAFLIMFEEKLDSFCCFRREDVISVEEPTDAVVPVQSQADQKLVVATDPALNPTVSKVVQGIQVGSQYIASGVQTAGSWVKSGLEAGSSFIVSKIDKGSEQAKVPDAIKQTVAVAKYVSPIAVKVSKTVVRGVAALAGAIGEEIGNAIHDNMKKNGNNPQGEVTTNAIALGKAALFGASTIWDGLTDAGKTMLDGAQTASGQIVTHKLGDEAGQLVHDSFDVGKDIYTINMGLKQVGLKGLTKSVAATAAKTVAAKSASSASTLRPPVASALPASIEGRSLVLQIADSSPSAPPLERQPVIVDIGDEDFVLLDDASTPSYLLGTTSGNLLK